MTAFSDLLTPETLASIREKWVGYLQAAQIKATNWAKDSLILQTGEAMNQQLYNVLSLVSQTVRGYATLDTATDPGDVDPYDATNAAQTPARGYLSEKGAGDYGTERLTQTFAVGNVTVTNNDTAAVTFAPEELTFQRTTADPATTKNPTYRNVADPTVYTYTGGLCQILAGASKVLPVRAEYAGTGSNVLPPSSDVTLVTVIGTPGTVTAAAAGDILGSDREGADAYRARCRLAPASVSPNGPADAFRYIALGAYKDTAGNVFYFQTSSSTTGLGIDSSGNIVSLPNAQGVSLGVTRVYVSDDSSIGAVDIRIAGDSGALGGTVATDLKALIDAIYWPDTSSRTLVDATNTTITVDGAIRAKAGPGVTADVIRDAIAAALAAAFKAFPIGGYDQTAGAGTIYKQEIESIVNNAHPAIYKVTLSLPTGDTALTLGHVATLTNSITSGDVTIA